MTDFPLNTASTIPYRARRSTAEDPSLLLMLHGLGSNELDLLGLEPAIDERFHLVSARAPLVQGEGSFAWFDIHWTPDPVHDPDGAERSRLLLLDFVDELSERYEVDHDRIYLLGFSQGAIMSLSVALTRPDKVAGVVAMSGRVLPEVVEGTDLPGHGGLPILLTHGNQDDVLPIHHARASRLALERLDVDLDYREYPAGHHISQENLDAVLAWLEARHEV